MPSFDVVSEVNHHELSNAVDQANREVSTRFDFKGTGSNFEQNDSQITLHTESEFQLRQMYDMLCNKLVKRGIDIACLEMADPVLQLKSATQVITVREGIESADSRKMVKLIKERKIKVQTAIQGDQLRVSGKKRDDLQAVMPAEMAQAAEIVALRALALSLAQVARVLKGDPQLLEPALAAHQATLEGRIRQLADTVEKVRALGCVRVR